MKAPHKHAKLIKAWADGAEIEFLYNASVWTKCIPRPNWIEDIQYRIKPEKKWFRVAEFHDMHTGSKWVSVTTMPEGEKEFEKRSNFVRWITDHIYYK